jgi:hypothetical protein
MDVMGTVHFTYFSRNNLIPQAVVRMGQHRPVPLSPWTLFSFRIPFFYAVNVYDTDVAVLILALVHSIVSNHLVPMKQDHLVSVVIVSPSLPPRVFFFFSHLRWRGGGQLTLVAISLRRRNQVFEWGAIFKKI